MAPDPTAAASPVPGCRTAGRFTIGAARPCDFIPTPKFLAACGFRRRALLYRMARSKAYLFRGLEIRWSCDPSLPRPADVPAEARLHFPGGLGDFLATSLDGQAMLAPRPFLGQADLAEGGKVEWAVAWPEDEEAGFSHSYCNTIPTPEGGTHEAGLRSALLRGHQRLWRARRPSRARLRRPLKT